MDGLNKLTKKKLRIFVGRHYGLGVKNNTHLMIDNLLPILRQKYDVTIIWFFYMSEKQTITKNNLEEFVDIHDYNNALDALKATQPDLVFDNDFPSLMDFAVDIAAKYLDIPVVTKIISTDSERTSIKQFFISFVPMFFHSSLPAEKTTQKKFMKRGRFFLFKYWFLLKTLHATKYNIFKIIQYFFIVLRWHIFYHTPYLDPRFQNKLQFLESEKLFNIMIEKGYDESTLFVTGNPIFDNAFIKSSKKNMKPSNGKIKILFAPIQLYEGGIWTKKQRDLTIKEIITSLSREKTKFSITVKLHPSSQIYSEYELLIHGINKEIPIYQKGSLEDYVENADVIVSFGTIYSSLLFALIAHKPLVLCNFINYQPETPIDHSVALECVNSSQLTEVIQKAFETNAQYQENVDNYLKKLLFKTDGKASERLCNAIEKTLSLKD